MSVVSINVTRHAGIGAQNRLLALIHSHVNKATTLNRMPIERPLLHEAPVDPNTFPELLKATASQCY
jgi:hypothetical protein